MKREIPPLPISSKGSPRGLSKPSTLCSNIYLSCYCTKLMGEMEITDLKGTIEMLCERIRKYRFLYEQNEMAVRDQIVNPTLRALGWNPENPEEVQPNVTTEEGIPDYSLLKDNKKILFVEAKKLSIDVEQRDVIRKLANYCFGEGMRYGVLTNGAVWMLFRAFQEGTTITERIVWKTDIEKDDVTATVRRLSTISKENIRNIERLIKKLQILDEIWKSLLDEPKELVKGFIPAFDNLIKEGYPEYEFDRSEIEDFIKERIKELVTPTEVTLEPTPIESMVTSRKMKIGTDSYEIRKSYEILINTAEWLIRKGKLKADDCPVAVGHKRNLVNTRPKHRYGDEFKAPKKLSNGLWIETHYSTASCINNARQLLERFGYSGNMLDVKNKS